MGCAVSTSVYWLHHPDHTDMFTQGYIGITNNLNARLRNHKSKKYNAHLRNAIIKYGWDNIIKEVILVADEAYCLMIEKTLRSVANIGWNIIEGGGKPPITRWNKGLACLPQVIEAVKKANTGREFTDEHRAKLSKSLKGHKVSEFTRERMRQMGLNKPSTKGKHFPIVQCPHCSKIGGIIPMKRWHMDKCKLKGIDNVVN